MRDLLSWVQFMNTTSPPLPPAEALYHGAHLACLDRLGCGGQGSGADRDGAVAAAEAFLQDILLQHGCEVAGPASWCSADIVSDGSRFGINPFLIEKGMCGTPQFLFNISVFEPPWFSL